MTDHDPDYDQALAHLRRLLTEALLRGELPSELQPERVQADPEDERRAEELRAFALAGDLDGLRKMVSSDAAVAGMNRGPQEAQEEEIPELDEARKRVEHRRSGNGGTSATRGG